MDFFNLPKHTGQAFHMTSLTEFKKNKLTRNYHQKNLVFKDIGFIFGLSTRLSSQYDF